MTSGQPQNRAEKWDPAFGDKDATKAISMQGDSNFALHARDGWNSNLAHDLLRVGCAALYWGARDALRGLPRRRARVLRLPAG
jgi:hypothetical protein